MHTVIYRILSNMDGILAKKYSITLYIYGTIPRRNSSRAQHTHTTVYYRIQVSTMYHAEEFVDLRWYVAKDLGARSRGVKSCRAES